MDEKEYLSYFVYKDIINGYSEGYFNNKLTYIKHFTVLDDTKVSLFKYKKYKEAILKGLKKESEQLKFLRDNNLWKDEDDLELANLEYYLNRLKQDLNVAWLPHQIKLKKEEISKAEKEYNDKLILKNNLIGLSAEKYAEKQSNDFFMYCSLFKDSECKIPLYNLEEFEDLDSDQIAENITFYYNNTLHLSIENIKQTAISVFFQNLYGLADNNYHFLGKPTSQFTHNQTNLISLGSYYKYILSEIGKDLPDEVRSDPEKLEERFVSSKNLEKIVNKKQRDNATVGIVGATKEDMEILGHKSDSFKEGNINKTLQEKGEISMMEAIKMGM